MAAETRMDSPPKRTPREAMASQGNRRPSPWLRLAQIAWLGLAAGGLLIFANGFAHRIDNLTSSFHDNLGLSLKLDEAGQVLILTHYQGQALEAGILERDRLVSVDGQPVTAASPDHLGALIPTGEAGTPVVLGVQTGDRPMREYTLLRGWLRGEVLGRLGLPFEAILTYSLVTELIVVGSFLATAALLFWKRADDWIALLASASFIIVFVAGLSPVVLDDLLQVPEWRLPLDIWTGFGLVVIMLFLFVFPDGRFVPGWSWGVVALLAIWNLLAYFIPQLYFRFTPSVAFLLILVACIGLGILAQVYRYRRVSGPTERQQTKWVVFGLLVALIFGVLGYFFYSQFAYLWIQPQELEYLIFDFLVVPGARFFQVLIPITIGIAVMRYRLWDIDLIINRTLVYGSLTLSTMALYILVVGGLGSLLQARAIPAVAFLATGLVAILFQPLRIRLQRSVNRLMYGERDDPYGVLARLSRSLEGTLHPEEVLPAIVATVTQALKLPYVAVALKEGDEYHLAATHGDPVEAPIELPLTYQNEQVGRLLVAPRAPGETLSAADLRLLQDIARQTGPAAHSVRLTADLKRSRQRIVAAQEEERRRLRRDLHDGLGPVLASQGLQMAAIQQLIDSDPQQARTMLDRVMAQNEATVGEIRRLVYGLRPPALDEMGLAGAIRDQALGSEGSAFRAGGLELSIETSPDPLPPLPAAVEVATYRIAMEALTNIARHAEASHCLIRINLEDGEDHQNLQLEIEDDGKGFGDQIRRGVGLTSMRERAEEVGGELRIRSEKGRGTCLAAKLPILTGK